MNLETSAPVAEAEAHEEGFYKNYGRVPAHAPLHPGMAYLDILEADHGIVPAAASGVGSYRAKPRLIPYHYFWDAAVAEREDEMIWDRQWLVACREEDIRAVGDRTVFDVRGRSYLIVRTGESEIKAYYNSCRHRGRTLCDKHFASGAEIRCQFHGWTYHLDGSVKWIPEENEFPVKDRRGLSLSEVRVEIWGGNVFINADPSAPPLAAQLGVLTEKFADFSLAGRYTFVHFRKHVRCNWKIAQDMFQEAYHTTETHWDLLAAADSTVATVDIWRDAHSAIGRNITPGAVPSRYVADKVSSREVVEEVASKHYGITAPADRGATMTDARDYLAELKRAELLEKHGAQIEDDSNAIVLDYVKYFMFPNFHPWWGYGFPGTYRFLPLGRDPEQSVMEVRWFAPNPPGTDLPPSVAPLEIGLDQRCADFGEVGFLGHVVDQDVFNMEALQKGVRAARPDRASPILASYQEQQLALFYEHYDAVMGFASS